MAEIEINGEIVKANQGEMLINVTDREGVSVPRFCYHKKLSVAANCRMCLVEIEGMPKSQPACSTPVADGMKIHTQSSKAKKSQQAVMEFLLINHPLDCPICDQGGECELQDVAMEYGSSVSRFNEGKRTIVDKDIGALIQTDMTRCIHCTRCVRFGMEIAGVMEMGGTGRGEHLKIEPFLEQGIESELSGNMIDVCPVGALTSKPFRYELRTWQMHATQTVSRHDLVGSNIYTQTYNKQLKRIVARENDAINETWIADRERFSYEGLTHENRLLKPQIKINNQWQEASWEEALKFSLRGLNSVEANKIAGLATNNATLEEFYLLRKMLVSLGSNNFDYRLKFKNLNKPIALKSNIKLIDLENVSNVLIIGANPRLEQPMINHRLRKASLKGATINTINAMQFDFNYELNADNIINPNKVAQTLAGVLKSVLQSKKLIIAQYLKDIKTSSQIDAIAQDLITADNAVIVLGEHFIGNDDIATIVGLVKEIAKNTDSTTLNLTISGNAMAAEVVSFTPNVDGLDVNSMLDSDLSAYLLLDIYPDYDFHNPKIAIDVLNKDGVFVIALNSFDNNNVRDYANVMLPIASFYESSGTHINIDGTAQSFSATISAPSASKPAWKVLKVLADLLKLDGFDYVDSAQVAQDAIAEQNNNIETNDNIDLTVDNGDDINVVWQTSAYAIDALLRHSSALRKTKIGCLNIAYMSELTAKQLKLSNAQIYLGAEVEITTKVAENCIFVHSNNVIQNANNSHVEGQK